MLLGKFYDDRSWLSWQRNLRQNRLYLSLYRKVSPRCLRLVRGFRGWELNDVRYILPRPTSVAVATKYKTNLPIACREYEIFPRKQGQNVKQIYKKLRCRQGESACDHSLHEINATAHQ